MCKSIIILFFTFINLISLNTLSFAGNDSHYAIAEKFVAIAYNKEAAYQNFIRFGVLSAKERYENDPKTKKYTDVLVNVVKEVLDAYFNDIDTQNKLKMIYAKIYMDEFTENELEEMISFYKTTTGQKILRKLPIITQKGWEKEVELASNLLAPKYEQMLVNKLEELQKKGLLPKEFK